MNNKAKELAIHSKDTGSSEIQIALLTEKIEIKIDRTEWNETNETKWK